MSGVEVRPYREGWAVFRGGVPVTRVFRLRHHAKATATKMRAADQRQASVEIRGCMCCGASFASEGKHNRLCKTCREGVPAEDDLEARAHG